jgi:hypothetical protein
MLPRSHRGQIFVWRWQRAQLKRRYESSIADSAGKQLARERKTRYSGLPTHVGPVRRPSDCYPLNWASDFSLALDEGDRAPQWSPEFGGRDAHVVDYFTE